MKQTVRFMGMTTSKTWFQPDGYRVLRNSKGHWLRRWLIRKMWQWLHNCGALEPYWHAMEVHEYTPARREDLSRHVMHAMDEVLHSELYGHARPSDFALIVGGDDFSEIMQTFVGRQLSFDVGPFVMQHDGYIARINDMPVHVVPHMQGVALVPKVVIEKEEKFMIDARTVRSHPGDKRVTALADAVNEASRKMWHAQMIVNDAREPSPKVMANLQAQIEEFRDASAAWAASYFDETGS